MTQNYLRNITPDWMTGVIKAYNGIRGSLVLINGPQGCRVYHANSAWYTLPRAANVLQDHAAQKVSGGMPDGLLHSEWYTGDPEVPATDVSSEEYIFGTGDQLLKALTDILAVKKYSLVALIQTPGVSLLGEALKPEITDLVEKAEAPCFFIESPELSGNSVRGYDDAVLKLLQSLPLCKSTVRKKPLSVNLFGMSMLHPHLEGNILELKRLFELCKIQINCIVCAGCTMEELKAIPAADLSIGVFPEYCCKTMKWLKEKLQLPCYICESAPIGFCAVEKMFLDIAQLLKISPQPVIEECKKGRARSYYYLALEVGRKGIPRDFRYAVEGAYSELYGYVSFLSDYLGILPSCISPLYKECDEFRDRLEHYLDSIGQADVLERDIMEFDNGIVLGNSGTIMALRVKSPNIIGIENSFPTSKYTNVIPKTHLGVYGALFLLEQILNGIKMWTPY